MSVTPDEMDAARDAREIEELRHDDAYSLIVFQDRWWRTSAGEWIRVDRMDPGHRDNLIGWLERSFEGLCWSTAQRMMSGPLPNGEMASLDFDRAIDELIESSLADASLYRRLVELRDAERSAVAPPAWAFVDEEVGL